MSPLYPNLGLVGQIGTHAGDAELDAALKKLVADALAPLKELDQQRAVAGQARGPVVGGKRVSGRVLDAPGDDVILYIDPPYYYPQHGNPIYDWDMSESDHRDLADRLAVCKHRFVLTINICGLTCELYEESGRFEVFRMPYRYSALTRGERFEYVITNF